MCCVAAQIVILAGHVADMLLPDPSPSAWQQVRAVAPAAWQADDNWLDTLLAAVDSSKLAILLVTPNFLASDFIMDTELQRLHARALKKELQP